MTSPITHEKIIEVLCDVTTAGNHAASQLVKRLGPDFVEDYFPATTSPETALNQMGDIVSYDFWVIWSAAMKARDLYQRLQAEKEGGDGGSESLRVITDGKHAIEFAVEPSGLMRMTGGGPVINQEGGDATAPGPSATDRPHVATPAPGENSGRAEAEERLLEKAKALVSGALGEPTIISRNMHGHLHRAIAKSLASEFAIGRRSGLEEAAKVVETTFPGLPPEPIAAAIRAIPEKQS